MNFTNPVCPSSPQSFEAPNLPIAEEAVLRISERVGDLVDMARAIGDRTGARRIAEPSNASVATPAQDDLLGSLTGLANLVTELADRISEIAKVV